ncbi:MAG: FapA family protein, partial [Desulfovibrionaceae bacterium]
LQGGEIVTARGVEALEIGSDLGVATTVAITWRMDEDIPLLKQRSAMLKKMKKIREALGDGEPRDILLRTEPARRPQVAELLKLRIRLSAELEETRQTLARHAARRSQAIRRARITAHRVIHPGVTLKIAGRVLHVHAPIQRSQIYFDPDRRELVVAPL